MGGVRCGDRGRIGARLSSCLIAFITCPTYCSLLILNSRYHVLMPPLPVYLRRKLG